MKNEFLAPRRLSRAFVTDPDTFLPLENAILFDGGEKLTDQTDSEIFLEIGIPELLKVHNAKRDELGLKAIKPRDPRMIVATLAYI